MLVCEGTETTSGTSYGKKLDPESIMVKRTFKFLQDIRVVKSGNFNYQDPNKNFKEEKKSTWVYSIDNSPDKFEEDTYIFTKGKSQSQHTFVSVSDTELYGSDKKTVDYDDKKDGSYEDYQVTINRISGDFRENLIQNFKGNGLFKVVTEGNCKKVEKKF